MTDIFCLFLSVDVTEFLKQVYSSRIAAKSVKHMIQQTLGKPVTQTADEANFGYCVHVWKRQRVSLIQREILNMSLAAFV